MKPKSFRRFRRSLIKQDIVGRQNFKVKFSFILLYITISSNIIELSTGGNTSNMRLRSSDPVGVFCEAVF
jgi:hypothetical protein